MSAKSKLSSMLSIVCSISLIMPIGIATSGAAQAQMRRTNAKMAAFNCANNRFTNGDFSIAQPGFETTGHQDIDYAQGWKAIWGNSVMNDASYADLFAPSEGSPITGNANFVPDGNWAGMWVSNRSETQIPDANFREGMFNELVTPIVANSGSHQFKFKTAILSNNGTGKSYIGIYGINRTTNAALPAAPTGQTIPTNINLFGPAKSVLLAKVELPAGATGSVWTEHVVNFPTSTFGALPQINHVMVTKLDASEGATEKGQARYIGFDDFCMQSYIDTGGTNTDTGNGSSGNGDTGNTGSTPQVPVNTSCPGTGCTDQSFSTCCPPSANTKLSKMLASVQPSIGDDYYLKFTLDPVLDAQMTAYGAYLKLLDPSYTGMAMTVRAFDGGSGNSPSVSGGPLEPEKAIYWNAGTPSGVQWPAGDLFSPATKRPVNNWTVVETVIWHTGPNRPWSMDCTIKRIAFRPQVVGGRTLPGTRGFKEYTGTPPASAARKPVRR